MEKKYFITGDLEKTLGGGVSDFPGKLQKINDNFRSKLLNIVNDSFGENIVEFITYDSIYNFFENLKNSEEFILSLDDGIYNNNSDFYFSSTRAYNSDNDILENTKSYNILQRNGQSLDIQNEILVETFIKSGKKEIIICDDGLFSGDTLKKVIYDLKLLGINIKEIRTILNFSGNNFLEGIPINSMYKEGQCIDWIDERDFFYGTKNGGASFWYEDKLNGLPYIFNPEIANKKASIPIQKSSNFCNKILNLNLDVWEDFQDKNMKNIKLKDLPRIGYLKEKYNTDISITELLKNELFTN